jgi:hypothetical protein
VAKTQFADFFDISFLEGETVMEWLCLEGHSTVEIGNRDHSLITMSVVGMNQGSRCIFGFTFRRVKPDSLKQ